MRIHGIELVRYVSLVRCDNVWTCDMRFTINQKFGDEYHVRALGRWWFSALWNCWRSTRDQARFMEQGLPSGSRTIPMRDDLPLRRPEPTNQEQHDG